MQQQGGGIGAIAFMSGCRTIIVYMPEMTITAGTEDLHALHAMAQIRRGSQASLIHRGPETRPA